MGYAPDYYPIAQAARFWGVAPWEIAKQSTYWIEVAEQISGAEAHAKGVNERKQGRARKRAGKRKR